MGRYRIRSFPQHPFDSSKPHGGTWTLAAYGIAGVLDTFVGERACSRDIRSAFFATAASMAAAVFLGATLGAHAYLAALFVTLWGLAFGAVPMCVQIWFYEAAPARFESGLAAMVTISSLPSRPVRIWVE